MTLKTWMTGPRRSVVQTNGNPQDSQHLRRAPAIACLQKACESKDSVGPWLQGQRRKLHDDSAGTAAPTFEGKGSPGPKVESCVSSTLKDFHMKRCLFMLICNIGPMEGGGDSCQT